MVAIKQAPLLPFKSDPNCGHDSQGAATASVWIFVIKEMLPVEDAF